MRHRAFLFYGIIFGLVLNLTISLSAEQRQVVQTGHTGEVRDIQWREAGNTIVSTGNDGSLKIWQYEHLVYSCQVSHLPLASLAVHPTKPVAVFVATDSINTYRLIAYNWETQTELYSLRLDELPLDIGFSPKGTYLYFSRTDQKSLTIMNSETGAPLNIADTSFGIVSSAFISSTEQTLVCYLASGSLLYWDLENNRQKTALISTNSNLDLIEFSYNGRYAVGYRSDSVYLIDLVSGKTLSTLSMPGIITQSMHPSDLKTSFIRNTGRYREITVVDFSDRTLKVSFHSPVPESNPLVLSNSGRLLYAGLDNGGLGTINSNTQDFHTWGDNMLADLTDIDLWNGSLTISSSGKLTLIDSQEFRSTDPGLPDQFYTSVIDLPFKNSAGFNTLDNRRGVIWDRETAGPTYLYDISSRSFSELFPVESACKEIYSTGDTLLSLDQNGTIILYDIQDNEVKYHYAASGLRDVTFIDKETIIAGRNPSRRFPSPLMRINLRTGETVPMEASDMLTYSLHFDPLTSSLYTLGLQERRGRILTVLRQLQGKNFERELPLLSYPGEDHNATFVLDNLRVITSLGHSGVQISGWNGFSSLGKVSHIPLRISSDNKILASQNSDSSISIWNKSSGKWLCDFYLFKDGEWAALTADTTLITSEQGSKYVRSFSR